MKTIIIPPLGMACFVIKTNLDDTRITLNDIFYGAAPCGGPFSASGSGGATTS